MPIARRPPALKSRLSAIQFLRHRPRHNSYALACVCVVVGPWPHDASAVPLRWCRMFPNDANLFPRAVFFQCHPVFFGLSNDPDTADMIDTPINRAEPAVRVPFPRADSQFRRALRGRSHQLNTGTPRRALRPTLRLDFPLGVQRNQNSRSAECGEEETPARRPSSHNRFVSIRILPTQPVIAEK